MTLTKEPFRSYSLDEERKDPKRDVTSLSLNREDRQLLEHIKEALNLHADSRAIRISLEFTRNVLIPQLSSKTWGYLFRKERSRLSDFRRLSDSYEKM